jgi:hypothetical protein
MNTKREAPNRSEQDNGIHHYYKYVEKNKLKRMAYSEFLADRVRERLRAQRVTEKKMMGGLIFMVNNKMCIGVDVDRKTRQDRIMVRVGKNAYEHLLKKNGCREMDFTGKPMKGFLFIYPEGFDQENDLDFWIGQALEFNKEALSSQR